MGSGLHISQSGFSANHHFVSSVVEDVFHFDSGDYRIEIFARQADRRKPTKLETVKLNLTADLAQVLRRHEGVLFERSVVGEYVGHSRDPHQKVP